MEKSKIAAIEPFMMKGQHQTWQKSGTTFYKFLITMEDGTNGTVLSKRMEIPWQTGEIVTFDFNNGFISNIRRAEERKNGNSYYEDPTVQQYITRNLCLKISIHFLSRFDEQANIKKGDIFRLAEKFQQWCYQDFKDNQHLLNRRSALERAMECREVECEGVVSSTILLNLAEEIVQWMSQESPSPF